MQFNVSLMVLDKEQPCLLGLRELFVNNIHNKLQKA